MLLQQVLAVVEKLRVGEVGQGDQFAVDRVGVGVSLEVRRQYLRFVGAEITVERLGPALRGPLRRTDDVDQDDVEHRVLRRQHGGQVLLLHVGCRAADLDLDLNVRISLLVFVRDLAHHVGPLLAAREDAQRRLLRQRAGREGSADRRSREDFPGLHCRFPPFFIDG